MNQDQCVCVCMGWGLGGGGSICVCVYGVLCVSFKVYLCHMHSVTMVDLIRTRIKIRL